MFNEYSFSDESIIAPLIWRWQPLHGPRFRVQREDAATLFAPRGLALSVALYDSCHSYPTEKGDSRDILDEIY